MKRSAALVFFVSILLFVITTTPALANAREEVLGVATPSSDINIPPTVEGPGLVLPDSPLFFLDELKQQARLLFAFTPETKLQVRASIAGERLAELRIMLARNNNAGVETDLRGIQDNLQAAADEVRNVQLSGRTVTPLAEDTNNTLKRIRASLDSLEAQTTGSVRARVRVAQDALQEAKAIVDEALPEPEKSNEIQDDLSLEAQRRLVQTSESNAELQRELSTLQKARDDEAAKDVNDKAGALKMATGTASQRQAQVDLDKEKEKQTRIHSLTQQAITNATQALNDAEKATSGFTQLEQLVQTLRNTPADQMAIPLPTPTPAPAK